MARLKLYLFRPWSNDADELAAVPKGLERAKVRPDVIFSSPRSSAWRTACAAAEVLTPGREPLRRASMVAGSKPTEMWQGLQDLDQARTLMLVAGAPELTRLAAYVLRSSSLSIELKKGGLLRIDVNTAPSVPPSGVVRWLLTAGQLVRLAD